MVVLGLVALAGLGFSGCAGGQSGSEGFCGENKRDTNTFTTESTDEDGGVEDEADADTQFVADDHGPEAQNGPVQCATDSQEH
jgi:hypothetical protein